MSKIKKYILLVVLVSTSTMLTGCIPANDHVGKPAAHSYKDRYYNDRYYY